MQSPKSIILLPYSIEHLIGACIQNMTVHYIIDKTFYLYIYALTTSTYTLNVHDPSKTGRMPMNISKEVDSIGNIQYN